MSFLERERRRMVEERDRLFKDPGHGLFFGQCREFVLNEAAVNLWEGIRLDAIEYFSRNHIAWWRGDGAEPTGHMLSSQIACLNHLYLIWQRPDLAKSILRALDPNVVEAEIVDDGYVEFEFIGEHQILAGKSVLAGHELYVGRCIHDRAHN